MYNGPYNYFGYYPYSTFRIMPRMGIINRFGNSFSFFKNVNWSNLINGASRTLGVVNQTIPLVKQVGPMFNNLRSMVRIMSIFRDETGPNDNKKAQKKSSDSVSNYQSFDNNNPTFFSV